MKIVNKIDVIIDIIQRGIRNKTFNKEEEYEIDIKKKSEKRSLSQNAMYWELLDQFAKWSGENRIKLHNEMMKAYGTDERTENGEKILVLIPDNEEYMYFEDLHLRPTRETFENKRWFIKIKNSRYYNKQEYTRLLDGLQNEIIGSGADEEIRI